MAVTAENDADELSAVTRSDDESADDVNENRRTNTATVKKLRVVHMYGKSVVKVHLWYQSSS